VRWSVLKQDRLCWGSVRCGRGNSNGDLQCNVMGWNETYEG
jgi:hypothetical protein